MNGSSAAIERILIVDDDAGAREGVGCSVEELGITPVPEPGPITDLDKFVAKFPDEAQAVVCGYRLKTGGAYSSFNGDDVVAACYRRGIPGLLCTQYTDVVVEMNRRLLRFIPSLLRTSSPPPQDIAAALRRCQEELAGSVHPARRPWRTLVRVRAVEEEAGHCHVVVPAWDAHQAIRLYFHDIPDEIVPRLTAGERLHAKVNIGARSFKEVYFDEWEPE